MRAVMALLLLGGVAAANPAAYLPPQCYAVTRDRPGGRTHNGCFACHTTPREPNYTDDAAAQVTLTFPAAVTENHWDNVRHPPAPAAIATDALLAWVRRSNYFDERGQLRLAQAPVAWDADRNGRFDGYLADCWFNPDERGFDRGPDGKLS